MNEIFKLKLHLLCYHFRAKAWKTIKCRSFAQSHLNDKVMITTLGFLGGVGTTEIVIIGLVVLVFFGAKRIPEFMKGLGKGAREFKDAMGDVKKEVDDTKRHIED
jgi:sec-independent protein translocase protein TatA